MKTMITKRPNGRTAGVTSVTTVTAATIFGVMSSTVPALAQDAREVTVDVEQCLDLASAEEQQACFGAEVNRALETQRASDAGAAAPNGEIARDRETTRERETGRDGETTNQRSAASEQPVARAAEETDSDAVEYWGTIVEMKEYLPSAYIIRLDNGQIWEQTEPKRYPLRPGLEVRIYPTRWGTRYRMAGVDSGGHIQVRRVQ